MTRGVLDTSVVIALDDDSTLWAKLPDELAISVATLAELHFGVSLARSPAIQRQRLQRLGTIEAELQALPIDERVARAYGALAGAVTMSGRKARRRVMGLWIAATASVHRVPLYTRNLEDFRGLEPFVRVREV